jgi:hypothetical protein
MEERGGISRRAGAGSVSRWADDATWSGEGLFREAFFFESGGERLYGSLYRAEALSRPDGMVICPSWGVEADRSSNTMHGLAFAMARLGGAALVFHYPGYGDSGGDLGVATMETLTRAAVDAVGEAVRRLSSLDWQLAGFTFGASVACLAQRQSAARDLLLLQPELRPGTYFRELARKAQRAAFGKDLERLAFGYPAPQAILDRASEADAAVAAALAEFEGGGAAVRHQLPELEQPDLLPGRLERLTVPGTWRFGSRAQSELRASALDWLKARAPVVGSGAR